MMKRKIPRFLIWTGIPFAIAGAILGGGFFSVNLLEKSSAG